MKKEIGYKNLKIEFWRIKLKDVILNKIKETIQNTIELNCEKVNNLDEANWLIGNTHATLISISDLLDLLQSQEIGELKW